MSAAPEQIGPYRVVRELGRGGMGVVYHARRDDLDRDVALKMLAGAEWDDDEARRRFLREARLAANLAGIPGIVAVHDAGEHEGRPYVAMDLVEGAGLDELPGGEPLSPLDAVRAVADAARAVHAAHQAGVLHRDLKPANLLRGHDGTVWVTDFGLARRLDAGPDASRLTKTGLLLGTPDFMPPEQARGESCDARADVYALGATLFDLLVGHPPFAAATIVAVLTGVLTERAPVPSAFVPGLPAGVDAVIACCLAKAPADRYASAAALAEDLERVLRGERVQARVPAASRRGARLAAAALAVAAIAGAAWWFRPQPAPPPDPAAAAAAELRALARDIDDTYVALSTATREPLQRLEDHWHGVRLPAQALQQAVDEVADAVREAQRSGRRGRGAEAWLLLARWYAGQDAADVELRAVVDATVDDPLPALLLARLRLAHWTANMGTALEGVGDTAAIAKLEESTSQRAVRDEAESLLRRARQMPVWPLLERTAPLRQFVEAATLTSAKDLRAACLALEGISRDPLVGPDAGLVQAQLLMRFGDFADAARAAEQAAQRGWAAAIRDAGSAWFARALQLDGHREPAGEAYRTAHAHYDAAVDADPRFAPARSQRALFLTTLARRAGTPPAERLAHLDQAVADIEEARRLDPRNLGLTELRARVLLHRSEEQAVHGGDVAASVQAAYDDARLVTGRRPNHAGAWEVQAEAARRLALRGRVDRRDPAPWFPAAADALAGWERSGPNTEYYRRATQLHFEWGNYLAKHGGDPVSQFEQAEAAAQEYERRQPDALDLWDLRGQLLDAWARFGTQALTERQARFAAAVEAYTAGLDHHPGNPRLLTLRGGTQVNHAQQYPLSHPASGPLFLGAIKDLDAALEADPGRALAIKFRASARSNYARWLMIARGDAGPWFEGAVEDFRALLARNPRHAQNREYLALTLIDFARFSRKHGRPAEPLLEEAIELCTTGLETHADHPKLLFARGRAHTAITYDLRLRRGPIRDIKAHAVRGRDDLEAAARLAPGLELQTRGPLAECRRLLNKIKD